MSAGPIFSARDVSKSFGKFKALDRVSLTLRSGERRALIGPNGAGKSTFINVIGGQLVGGSDGEITFEGNNISGASPAEIAHKGIGRTFQISRTYRAMTVYENMASSLLVASGRAFSLSVRHLTQIEDEVFAHLERVQLADLADAPAEDISHGDCKRLEFGMALSTNPRLLLLDEPTAGMGLKERYELMDLVLDRVENHGITLLFVEHDIDVVFKIAERITVMAQGKVFAEGDPKEIAANSDVQDVYLGTRHAAH